MFSPAAPTEKQAAHLLQLAAPAAPEPPQDARRELEALLRVCRVPWVADFIFNPEMTSLPTLTAPLNMQSAVTCSVTMTNVEVNAFGDHPFDFHLDGAFVFVPAFSVAPLSVGFGVQECNALFYNDWCGTASPESKMSHFRYVRDDKNAVLFIIHRDGDTVKVESMRQLSGSTRRRTFASFSRARLQAAVRTDRGILHPDDVLPSLTVLNTVTEQRDCRKCNAPAAGPCRCSIDLELPSHPLDFGVACKNMMSFVGAYTGMSRASVLQAGTNLLSSNVGSRIQIDGGIDDDLISRLSRWAITDQIKEKPENPLSMIMPARSQEQSSQEVDMIDMVDMALPPMEEIMAIDVDMNLFDGQAVSGNAPQLPEVPNTFFDPLGKESSSCSSGTGILIASSLDDEPGKAGYADLEEAVRESDEKVLELVNKITGGLGSTAVPDANVIRTAVNVNGSEGYSLESLTSDGSGNGGKGRASRDGLQRAESGDGVSEKQTGTRMVSIAPAAAIETNVEMDEKERRALLRKQRNREAAHRSNLKRKQKNDSLKQALKETHEKAAELRARELVLREENLRLRKMAS